MRFRVSFEFDIDRSSVHVWADDEEGVSSMEDLLELMFHEQDIDIDGLEIERVY